ncbi:hypothetical protein SPLC1_S208840 [Arthrospira platensis C1]|nr:hypothetical protein SPLC1_S208840 [Arthrospira platensis C1]
MRPKAEVGVVIQELIFIAIAAEENEFQDLIIHIPLK